jgi:hypothetical protein
MLDKIVDRLFEKLAPILVERLSALLPVVVAAVAKDIGDQLKSQLLMTFAPGAGLTDSGVTEPAVSERGFCGAADTGKSRQESPQ